MQLLVTYNKYKSVLNLPENLTEPENFQIKQWQALDYIYRNISQIHLFPVSKGMYDRMKPAYRRQFETALCEQIKYMINNASIFDDPASVIVSSSIGNYAHGPMGDKTLSGFIKLLAPITDNLLTALGWRYMSLDDKLPFEDYYDTGYDEFFLRSISKDDVNHVITIFDNNGTPTSFGYADLPPYEPGKFLHVNSETGELEWTDVATPILENFYTKAESDARFAPIDKSYSKTESDAKYELKGEGGKVLDVKVDGSSVVTDKIANINLSVKQNKVHYGATEPVDPKDNDIWVQESMDAGVTQKQSDWNQTDSSQVDFIKNKPAIATTISASSTNNEVAGAKAVYDYIESLDGNGTSY